MSKKVPDDAPRPCLCGTGTLQPIPGDVSFDADGSAMVGLRCDSATCSIESVHYWAWK